MSKSINIFGFHSIESILINKPELVLKVLIQNGRKDKRIVNLINNLDFEDEDSKEKEQKQENKQDDSSQSEQENSDSGEALE